MTTATDAHRCLMCSAQGGDAAGVTDNPTRRALRDELVGQARTLADCIE